MINETKRIAYHESGHVLIHIISQVPFTAVSITPSEGTGRLHVDNPTRAHYIFHAQVAMAGTVSERILEGKIAKDLANGRLGLAGEDKEDFDKAVAAIMEDEYEMVPLVSWLFVRTANQLAKRWPVVQAIAEALLKKEYLTYAECKSIAMRAISQKIKGIQLSQNPNDSR